MTDTICETQRGALTDAMDGEPWQMRLRALGFSQVAFADAMGLTPTNLSEGLRGRWQSGVPQSLKAVILALEAMDEAQRDAWLTAARRERQKP